MPSDSWGEIVLPADPEDLVGMPVTVVRRPDGKVALGVDPGFPTSAIPPTVPKVLAAMKVTINGVQLGLPEKISTRVDEIGESVTEVSLSESALNKLYEEHGKAQITQTDIERILGAMQPTMEICEAMKKTLAERGWTYEEAERIAGDVLRDSITQAMKGAMS